MTKPIKVTIGPDRTVIEHRLVDYNIETSNFMSTILGHAKGPSGILPPVVRSFDSRMRNFLVERTPFFANIWYKNCGARGSSEHKEYRIPIPWTSYLIFLNQHQVPSELYVYARDSQITDEKDELGYLPLPNTYNTGGTCLGEASFGKAKFDSVSEAVSLAVNAFWTSSFNNDLAYWLMPDLNEGVRNLTGSDNDDGSLFLQDWATLSVPEILSVHWNSASKVDEALDSLNRSLNNPTCEASLATYLSIAGSPRIL